MSSLDRRSESPRKRIERGGSRTHPGWACFMLAFGSGMFTTMTIVYAAIHMDRGFLIYAGIAMVLFIMGGKKAEKLWDRS